MGAHGSTINAKLKIQNAKWHRCVRIVYTRGAAMGTLHPPFGTSFCILNFAFCIAAAAAAAAEPFDLDAHLTGIADLASPSPMIPIPSGPFLMGTDRRDGAENPYSLDLQFDNTEQPQRRVSVSAFAIDRDEVSLGEYLAWLREHHRPVPDELRRLIQHVITIHFMPDATLTRWPALYVTWGEAAQFCRDHGKRLPSEAEWEKAARGTDGNLFPWGHDEPTSRLAVFGRYHAHEIPLVAAVETGEAGKSPYGVHHMAGNIAEWVHDWFGVDYYAMMPDRNPAGPSTGRYKVTRGGSWKSHQQLLRSATRNGAVPDQRAPTIGFRCAKSTS
jgi:formylglycine-generating enzyme required for sulfatase activity